MASHFSDIEQITDSDASTADSKHAGVTLLSSIPTDAADIDECELSERKDLRQGLHQRHIQMIALAGTIGTGLFLGSGRALAHSGPLGILLGYSIVGLAVAPVVMAVGEMGALVPLSGGVVRYIEYFLDPAMAFANGWNLVYSYLVGTPAEITAAAVLVQFWSSISPGVWITIFGLLMVVSSLLFVRVYGELEFGFSILKIVLIIGLNIMALIITTGALPGRPAIGFRYWHQPGAFVQYLSIPGPLGRFLGFWTAMSNALYAYSGIDTIATAAAEVHNPRQAIPLAAKRIFIRISLFYILTILMVGLVVPSNDPHLLISTHTATESPFVVAANLASIPAVPSIINAAVLTSAWSAGNSGLLNASRVLYGLARHGHAPRFLTGLNRFGAPYVAVLLVASFIPLAFMSLSRSAAAVFGWLQDLVAVSSLVSWIVVCVTYLRFHAGCRAQGLVRGRDLPWAAPGMPYAIWFSLGLFSLLLLTGGWRTFVHGQWDTETFVASYFNVPFVLVLYLGYKTVKRTRVVGLHEMPITKFVEIYKRERPPKTKKRRGWQRLNIFWS